MRGEVPRSQDIRCQDIILEGRPNHVFVPPTGHAIGIKIADRGVKVWGLQLRADIQSFLALYTDEGLLRAILDFLEDAGGVPSVGSDCLLSFCHPPSLLSPGVGTLDEAYKITNQTDVCA